MKLQGGERVTALDPLVVHLVSLELVTGFQKCVVMILNGEPVAVLPACASGDHSRCRDTEDRTQHGYVRFLRDEEGETWARGWDTKEAEALEVAYALGQNEQPGWAASQTWCIDP